MKEVPSYVARGGFVITPGAAFPTMPGNHAPQSRAYGIYVTNAGTIVLTDDFGTSLTFVVDASQILPIVVASVESFTGAGPIIGFRTNF